MTLIYLTFTPLHILTSCGLALKAPKSEIKLLIVINDFPNAKKYIKSILNWKLNPFKKVYLLMGRISFDKKPYFIQFFYYQLKIINIHKIWSEINNKTQVNLYLFNDYTIEAQFLLSKNKTNLSRNIYLDDGIASYWPFSSPYYSFPKVVLVLRKIVSKLLYGFWYEIPNIYGSSKRIHKMFSFYPELVTNYLKLKFRKIKRIPTILFNSLNKTGLITQIFNNFKIEIEDSFSNCIILLPNSKVLHMYNLGLSKVRKIIIKIIQILENHFETIYLKYHPREQRIGYIGYNNKKIKLINSSIAIELVLFLLNSKEESETLLIGSLSSAFITTRFIMKKKPKIVCFDKILQQNLNLTSLSQKFKRLDVLFPQNFSELVNIVKKK